VLQDFETQERPLFELFSSADSFVLCASGALFVSGLSLQRTSKIDSQIQPGLAVLPIHPQDLAMKKTSQRLIHVLIFAGLRTQKSWERRCNKQNEPYYDLPGTWLGWLRFRKRTMKLHLRTTRQFFLIKSHILKT
jgi:hypothetical protein